MARNKRLHLKAVDDTSELKNRLEETEETLHAIRQYLVDAFVVSREGGQQVVTLSDASFPYRMMVESMNEGAVTLIPDGTIFYANTCFSRLVQVEADKLIGVRFRDLVLQADQAAFDEILKQAGGDGKRGEFCLRAADGSCVTLQLSVYWLSTEEVSGIAILATDITERIQAAEKIRSLASELTMVEQEERHRISQILHDDLQQRLFAIRAHLSMLQESDGSGNLSAEAISIDQIQGWLAEAITITRNLSVDISPVVLQGDGLAEAVTWLAAHMKEQHGLQVEVEASENFRQLDEHMRVLLFQAIRELLFNVVKHAGTLQATVRLEEGNGSGRITVSDLGRGFDSNRVLQSLQSAHGLLIVKDRLGLMGCEMEIDSQPGEGTRVTIEIPMEKTTITQKNLEA